MISYNVKFHRLDKQSNSLIVELIPEQVGLTPRVVGVPIDLPLSIEFANSNSDSKEKIIRSLLLSSKETFVNSAWELEKKLLPITTLGDLVGSKLPETRYN